MSKVGWFGDCDCRCGSGGSGSEPGSSIPPLENCCGYCVSENPFTGEEVCTAPANLIVTTLIECFPFKPLTVTCARFSCCPMDDPPGPFYEGATPFNPNLWDGNHPCSNCAGGIGMVGEG